MSELPSYLASVVKTIDHMIDRYFVDKTGELNKASAHLLAAGGSFLEDPFLHHIRSVYPAFRNSGRNLPWTPKLIGE
jgi:hypothetical protein